MPIDRIFARYRLALCGSTGLMVGMSWPLWVESSEIPRVPFFAHLPVFPPWVSWVSLLVIVACLGLASLGRAWRILVGVSLVILVVSVVQDQNRLQPWIYQFGVIGLGLVGVARGRALRMARWYMIGLYAYSGLSKLDASFCQELGPTFLSAALGPIGIDPTSWPDGLRISGCLAMPGFELVVAGLLAGSKTRRAGLIGSIVLHALLVAILGPWSLGHSAIVLVWNLSQVAEIWILFGPSLIPLDPEPDGKLGLTARLLFWLAMILPVGERIGWADAWPSHALYASHVERSEVFVHEDDLDRFPESIRRRLGPANATPWRRLDLTGWSRDVRGTPIYPSGRVGNGLAEFLEIQYAPIQPIRLVQRSRATIFGGQRVVDESLGLRAIRRRGDRFLFNARPSRSSLRMID